MTAEEDEVALQGQAIAEVLVELKSIRAEVDDLAVGALRFQLLQASVDGFNHQNHARPAPVRGVVNGFVFAGRVVAEVMDHDLGQAFALSPAQDAVMHQAVQQFGNGGQDINPHRGGAFRRYQPQGRGPTSHPEGRLPILGWLDSIDGQNPEPKAGKPLVR